MSLAVFTFKTHYPMEVELEYEEETIHCGPGIDKTVQHELTFTNSDLTGQVVSRIGTAVFWIKLNTRDYAGDATFISILRFFQARKLGSSTGVPNEPFYFYNPTERATADPTGVATTGRYKVKLASNLAWSLKMAKLNDFTTITLREDRS